MHMASEQGNSGSVARLLTRGNQVKTTVDYLGATRMGKNKTPVTLQVGSGVGHLTVWSASECVGCFRGLRNWQIRPRTDKQAIYSSFLKKERNSWVWPSYKVSHFTVLVQGQGPICGDGCAGNRPLQGRPSGGEGRAFMCILHVSVALTNPPVVSGWAFTLMTLYNPSQPLNIVRLSFCPLKTSVAIKLQQEL